MKFLKERVRSMWPYAPRIYSFSQLLQSFISGIFSLQINIMSIN